MEIAAKVFWSYAHADNEREHGRILRLADLVRAEYEMLTGATIEIFTDRAEIAWGDDFRQKLEQALQETAFFIPVLTPTYFLRDECRKEMSQFVRSASDLGLQQLLLSIHYIPVADLTEQSADELKAVAASMEHEPWSAMRLLDEDSAEHRRSVNRLATRLVDLTMRLESGGGEVAPSGALGPPKGELRENVDEVQSPTATLRPVVVPSDIENTITVEPGRQPKPEEEPPGLIDLVADAQPAMAAWATTVSDLTPVTERFNQKVQATTHRMNQVNSGPDAFARKILAARELAADVEPELGELERLSKDYSAGLIRIDSTIRAVYELVALSDPEDVAEGKAVLNGSLAELISNSKVAMRSLEGAADAARENAKLSRDLRPVLRRYETAVRNMVDASSIIEEWESLDKE